MTARTMPAFASPGRALVPPALALAADRRAGDRRRRRLRHAWIAVVADDGVIADDYYKRGLLINKDARARRGAATRCGLGAIVRVGAGRGARASS